MKIFLTKFPAKFENQLLVETKISAHGQQGEKLLDISKSLDFFLSKVPHVTTNFHKKPKEVVIESKLFVIELRSYF